MSDSHRKPTIGLVLGGGEWSTGFATAARRHVRLLHEHVRVLPILLEDAPSPASWIGRVAPSTAFGAPGYAIAAANFRVDEMLGTIGVRARSLADHLLALVKREGIDALHLLGVLGGELVAAAAAAQADLPLVVSFLGPDLGGKTLRRAAEYRILARAATACTVPATAHERLVRRLLPDIGPIHVIPPHATPDASPVGQEALPVASGAPPVAQAGTPLLAAGAAPASSAAPQAETLPEVSLARPVIGCFGEFCRAGGLDVMLEAFTALARERGGTLLLVGGVRPLEAFYYSQVLDHHPFSERIHRTGHVPHEQVGLWMRQCDVIALPSVQDGMGHVMREAMASEIPTVASCTEGVADFLHHGIEARVVPPRDPGALREAIASLLDDPESARHLAARALQAARTRHTAPQELDAWLACYREVGLCL